MMVHASRSRPPADPAEGKLYFCTIKWEQGAKWDQVLVGGVGVPTKRIEVWFIGVGPTTRFTLKHYNTENRVWL